jgi:hypothetical protein
MSSVKLILSSPPGSAGTNYRLGTRNPFDRTQFRVPEALPADSLSQLLLECVRWRLVLIPEARFGGQQLSVVYSA